MRSEIYIRITQAMGIINNKLVYYLLKILEISVINFQIFVGLSPGIIEGISKYVPKEKQF